MSRRRAGRWSRQEQEQPQEHQAARPAAAATSPDSTTDMLAQLKELGELKSQGVLTEAEFDGQKRRILNAAS